MRAWTAGTHGRGSLGLILALAIFGIGVALGLLLTNLPQSGLGSRNVLAMEPITTLTLQYNDHGFGSPVNLTLDSEQSKAHLSGGGDDFHGPIVVQDGGLFTILADSGEDKIGNSTIIGISFGGGSGTLNAHTSCSQPLDFGTLFGNDGDDDSDAPSEFAPGGSLTAGMQVVDGDGCVAGTVPTSTPSPTDSPPATDTPTDTPPATEPPSTPTDTPTATEPPNTPTDTPPATEPPNTPTDTPTATEPPNTPTDTPTATEPPNTPTDTPPATGEPTNTPTTPPATELPTDAPAHTPPATEPTGTPTQTTPACEPAYPDECLPPGEDHDCFGDGNEPPYVEGPIVVLPPDPYDLDPDGDGIGCDSETMTSQGQPPPPPPANSGLQPPAAGTGPAGSEFGAGDWLTAALIGAGLAWLLAGLAAMGVHVGLSGRREGGITGSITINGPFAALANTVLAERPARRLPEPPQLVTPPTFRQRRPD
jgi:hypothetical protein